LATIFERPNAPSFGMIVRIPERILTPPRGPMLDELADNPDYIQHDSKSLSP
jgi:hypothetical protein